MNVLLIVPELEIFILYTLFSVRPPDKTATVSPDVLPPRGPSPPNTTRHQAPDPHAAPDHPPLMQTYSGPKAVLSHADAGPLPSVVMSAEPKPPALVAANIPLFDLISDNGQLVPEAKETNIISKRNWRKKKTVKKNVKKNNEPVAKYPCEKCPHVNTISITQSKVIARELFFNTVKQSDKNCFFWTGIPLLGLFFNLFNYLFVSYDLEGIRNEGIILNTQQEFMITLILIRRGLNQQVLGTMVHVCQSSISKIFFKWVRFYYQSFPNSITDWGIHIFLFSLI